MNSFIKTHHKQQNSTKKTRLSNAGGNFDTIDFKDSSITKAHNIDLENPETHKNNPK